MSTGTARKIELLRNLIEHPRTGEAERDAARRMLARLQAKTGVTLRRPKWEPAWRGAKYDGKFLSTTEIAKLIREDIKTAVKIAKLTAAPGSLAVHDAFAAMPEGLKFGVRVPHYGSLKVTVKNIPHDWGYVHEDRYGNGEKYDYPSEALRALGRELHELANAYNYDNSDIQTDYFDKRYYLSVTSEDGAGIDF